MPLKKPRRKTFQKNDTACKKAKKDELDEATVMAHGDGIMKAQRREDDVSN